MALTAQDLVTRVPHLDPAIAEEWVGTVRTVCKQEIDAHGEFVSRREFEKEVEKRLSWYVQMMTGFGPSDIGILVLEHTGGYAPFNMTAQDVIRQKVGMKLPEPASGDLARRRLLEPVARRQFLDQMRHRGLAPHVEAIECARNAMRERDPDHPWLVGALTDVFLDREGKTWLVGFRIPRSHERVLEMYEDPSLMDKAPLAQQKILLERAGVNVDHVVIVPFSTAEMEIYPTEITITAELEQQVLAAGDHYWDHVLRQELPSFTPKNAFQDVPASKLPPGLRRKLARFTLLKRLESRAKNESDSLKTGILNAVREAGVAHEDLGGRTRVPFIDISYREQRRFNQQAAQRYIHELGGDPDDPRLFQTKENQIVEVIRGKSSPYADDIAQVDGIASRVIDDGTLDIAEAFNFDALGTDDVSDPRDEIRPPAKEETAPGF